MGRGSYTASDWLKLSNSRGLNDTTPASRIYRNTAAVPAYTARTIGTRLSRDSEDSPRSTPVILGFDVTASMGFLAEEIARRALNTTILSLHREKPITDPHILCAALGDCRSDRYPLQVTQFEADIRIAKQLLELHLEGGGGGNGGESYNLLWYFAARHTETDSFEKRQQKGLLFTIGDDRCHPGLSPAEISAVFGDRSPYTLSNQELIREAEAKYDLFHIHIAIPGAPEGVFQSWQMYLPGRVAVIPSRDISLLPELILTLAKIAKGQSVNAALKALDQKIAEKLAPGLASIAPKQNTNTNIISF